MNLPRKIEELADLARLFIAVKRGMLDKSDYEQLYNLNAFMMEMRIWKNNGMKTFVLTQELVEAFQHTDIPYTAYPCDFQYPFNSFVIESEDIPLFMTTDGGEKPVGVHAILYMSADALLESGISFLDENNHEIKTLHWDHAIRGLFPNGSGVGLDCLVMTVGGNQTLESSLEKGTIRAMKPLLASEHRMLINLFYNTMLYISDPTRSCVETQRGGSRKCKDGKGGKYTSRYILLRPPKTYIPLHTEGTGRHIDKRFVVRGHWRNQAIGEKRARHRYLWIKPYWKGPETSEIISRPYLVDKKD